jgi:hypothetical protein
MVLPGAIEDQLTDWIMTHRRPAFDAAIEELAAARLKDLIREVRLEETPGRLDDKGLPIWAQMQEADGAMVWGRRRDMNIQCYAWNYLAHAKNRTLGNRWREEAVERWSACEFNTEVERLREEREEGFGAA